MSLKGGDAGEKVGLRKFNVVSKFATYPKDRIDWIEQHPEMWDKDRNEIIDEMKRVGLIPRNVSPDKIAVEQYIEIAKLPAAPPRRTKANRSAGHRLTMFRKRSRLTRAQIADVLGLTPWQLKNAENGKPLSPQVRARLEELIAAMGIDVGYDRSNGVAEYRAELNDQRWIYEHKRGMVELYERLGSAHLAKMREEKKYCLCPLCVEGRKTWGSLAPGDPKLEPMLGGLCYWAPVVVWSCQKCAYRWPSESLEYPQKCPNCDSPEWNGVSIERKYTCPIQK